MGRNTSLWRGGTGLLACLLLLGACGGDDDGGAEATPDGAVTESDEVGETGEASEAASSSGGDGLYGPVCELLTAADVEAALGSGPEQNADDEELGACHYTLSDGVTVVTFQVTAGHAYDANLEALGEVARFEDVSGLGERASWSEDAFVGGYLMVLAGDRVYSVSGAGSLETSTQLMEQALART